MGVLKNYVSTLKRVPQEAMAPFKGKNKIKNTALALGGAAGTFMLGGMLTASVINPALTMIPGGSMILGNAIGKRVVGASAPLTIGFIASRFIKGDIGKALLAGGALASIVELIQPGLIGQLIYRTPVVGPTVVAAAPAAATKGPVQGMDGYVDARAYQGTGDMEPLAGYVDARAYQGTGEELDGYVDARAYQGTGDMDEDDLAGVGSYIDDGANYMKTYLS